MHPSSCLGMLETRALMLLGPITVRRPMLTMLRSSAPSGAGVATR